MLVKVNSYLFRVNQDGLSIGILGINPTYYYFCNSKFIVQPTSKKYTTSIFAA